MPRGSRGSGRAARKPSGTGPVTRSALLTGYYPVQAPTISERLEDSTTSDGDLRDLQYFPVNLTADVEANADGISSQHILTMHTGETHLWSLGPAGRPGHLVLPIYIIHQGRYGPFA